MKTLADLKDKSLFVDKAYIGGDWVSADNHKTYMVRNPATGETLGSLPFMGVAETVRAIVSAEKAFRQWKTTTAKTKGQFLRKLAGLMVANKDDLALIMTLEQGKPLAEALGEILYAASFIEWFAEEARRVYGDVIPTNAADRRIIITKEPVGVCAAITPWNFPSAMLARKFGPAVAAGCSFVVKPAHQTPYSALAMAVLCERAGITEGLLSVITGDAKTIGQVMTTHNLVRKVTFTGSTATGKILMQQSASTVKRLSLELGGNAPFIVFDDANLDEAVQGALVSKFRNNGQTCVCANRIYAQQGIAAEFTKGLTEKVKKLKVGNGTEDLVDIGPLIDTKALAKVEEHIADALAKGGKLETGGKRHALGGTYFEPCVLSAATHKMLVAKEETFGPLAPVFTFKDEAEVIQMANDTEFGLAAYFFTRDIGRIWRVAEGLEYGMVGINTGVISTAEAPFGGMKQSGIGREGSKYGIEEYLEVKYLSIAGLDS